MAYELTRHLSTRVDVRLVKFTWKSEAWLPVVYLSFLLKTMLVMRAGRVDAVYLTDAVLAPLGVLIRRMYGVKVLVVVHGLDVTFENAVFQRIVPRAVSALDTVVCVSPATQKACLARGIPETKTVVIPNGTTDCLVSTSKQECRALVEQAFGIDVHDAFLVLSVGRLVKRKGFHWFTDQVVPELLRREPKTRYAIVGDGPMAPRLREVVQQRGLHDQVWLLTDVDNQRLKLLYKAADVLVAPNIRVQGDMEGFGIVLLEAGSCGLHVVAADIEGPSEVLQGFGRLVPEGDAQAFADAVLSAPQCGSPRDYVLSRYSWEALIERHLASIYGSVSEEAA